MRGQEVGSELDEEVDQLTKATVDFEPNRELWGYVDEQNLWLSHDFTSHTSPGCHAANPVVGCLAAPS
jgi:hypothetical protein